MNKYIICVYHGGCSDGVLAAWAFHDAHRDTEVLYIPGRYGDPATSTGQGLLDYITNTLQLPEQTAAECEVWFVDYSMKREEMCRFIDQLHVAFDGEVSVGVLDHHKSAEAELLGLLADGTLDGCFDMDRCGAMLTWDWFNPNDAAPVHIHYADARDRWQQKGPLEWSDVTRFTYAQRQMVDHMDPLDFRELDAFIDTPLHQVIERGAAIHGYVLQRIREVVKATVEGDLFTVSGGQAHECKVPFVNIPHFLASEVAGLLAERHPSGIGVGWWYRSDGKVTLSLRSRGKDGPDVSQIAVWLGGGGHHGAAGCEVTLDGLQHMLRNAEPFHVE